MIRYLDNVSRQSFKLGTEKIEMQIKDKRQLLLQKNRTRRSANPNLINVQSISFIIIKKEGFLAAEDVGHFMMKKYLSCTVKVAEPRLCF